MRGLLWLVAVFAAAVALVIFGRASDSYALFVYPPYRVEISLLFFAVLFATALGLLYFFLRTFGHLLALPTYVRAYRERRRLESAQAAFASALLALYEGRYARAEKDAAIAFSSGSTRGLAALIAAQAAHQLRNFTQRDTWLDRAAGEGEKMKSAQLVTRASLALEERDYESARGALRQLGDNGHRQIASLRMLLRAERGLGNWEEVLRLALLLANRDAIAAGVADEHRIQAHVELLARAAGDREQLERRWRAIPAVDQVHPRVATEAARHANLLGAMGFSRQVLEQALEVEWNSPLVSAYGDLAMVGERERAQEARHRIERAEKWLLKRTGDPKLLATLGQLCQYAELWGKAEACLEASLSFEESRSAHLALARLLESLGRGSDAQRHFRRAAEVTA